MELLKDKVILLVSTQPWEGLKVSKHHYAEELAKLNEVYYLEPPERKIGRKIKITKLDKGLKKIDHQLFFPYVLIFHWRKLFDFLMSFHIKRLVKSLPKKPDICWCFDSHVYSELKVFSTDISIYHPADLFDNPRSRNLAREADLIISVADNILNVFREIETPKLYLNHGLCKELSAQKPIIHNKEQIQCGYMGNIAINTIDRVVFKKLVNEFKTIQFVVIGEENANPGTEASQFLEFLRNSDNVVLKGIMSKAELKEELERLDLFVLCYDNKKDVNQGANSHKLLEYLSFGKMIVANMVTTYLDKYPDIVKKINMVKEESNSTFIDLFRDAINNLEEYNNVQNQEMRIEFANKFTYHNQVSEIDTKLQQVLTLNNQHN